MSRGSELTPTEQRIYNLLRDGEEHGYSELFACLSDDMAGITAVQFHLSKLRSKLPPGDLIVCVYKGHSKAYRYVGHVRYPRMIQDE